ncbi:MAG: hypothetical protein SGILL_010704, partial [Bacillariaceae sp.]
MAFTRSLLSHAILLVVLILSCWTTPSVAENLGGSLVGAQVTDASTEGQEAANKPKAKRQSSARQGNPNERSLSTFTVKRDDGSRNKQSGCGSNHASNTQDYSKDIPKADDPPPRRNPDREKGQGRRRLRNRVGTISGFVGGDEAAVEASDRNAGGEMRGKKGSSVYNNKYDRDHRGDDDDGGEEEEDETEPDSDPDCEEDAGAEAEADVDDADLDADLDAAESETSKTYIIVYKPGLDENSMIATDTSVQGLVQATGGEVKYEYNA